MVISKQGSSLVFTKCDVQYVIPSDKIQMIAKEESETVTVRLMGSRKNVVQFRYDETNLEASDALDLISKIIELIG